MKTQAIQVQQGRRGQVIVQPSRRRNSPTAWALIALVSLPLIVIRGVARFGWRNRWHLAPLAGGAWVLAYGVAAPAATLTVLGLVAFPSAIWAWRGRKVGGRMWLSVLERAALAEGMFGAGLWVAGEWAAAAAGVHSPVILGSPALLDIGAYVLLTGHATGAWWWSRRPTWLQRTPKAAGDYVGQWDAVAEKPGGFHDSYVDHDTREVTDDGDVSFDVIVAGHADDITEDSRRVVESTIKVDGGADLPHRSVQVAHVDRSVKRVRVTISPDRAMESAPVLSEGIQPLDRDGGLVLLKDTARRPIRVHRFSKSGARHAMVSGGTDAGKSNTLARLILPGLLTVNDRGLPIETVWSLDGGRGTSTPYLAPAFDINATQPWQFPILLDAFFAVHLGRERRRGLAGRHDWRTWEEEDQILTLLIQEARGVAPYLSAQQHRNYATMAMRARKIGMSLIQEGQDFARGNAVGGEDMPEVRKQLAAGGVVLAHRDGDNDKRTLQGSHDAVQLVRGVNSLPAGGGWVIPIEQGTVLAKQARTVWDDIDVRAAAAASVTPRPMADADLEDALTVPGFAELYEHRHDPLWTPPQPEKDDEEPDEALVSGPRPFQPVDTRPTETAKHKALRVIRERYAEVGDDDEPLSKKQICDRAGISAGSWQTAREQLAAEGLIRQSETWPGKWIPAFPKGS